MALKRFVTLNNGLKIPQIGFGTWQSRPGEVEEAVSTAIKIGYRHIDCARVYENQPEVAIGIERSGVPRNDLFLVGKLWNTHHRPHLVQDDLEMSLEELKTNYLDVYLMHFPVAFKPGKEMQPLSADGKLVIDPESPGITKTWAEVCRLYKEKKGVRAIGVSNFSIAHLEAIINATGVVPAVNQIEGHPSLIQKDLYAYCKDKGIQITAYSPMGNNSTGKPRIIDSPAIKEVADRLGKTSAQVLIAWATHNGFCVIPKSLIAAEMENNFDDFELSQEDFETISEIGMRHPYRGNLPVNFTPQVPINLFGEPEEQSMPHSVVF
ncbi:hypothetical protein EHS25_002106 [Saitozyma podzolica]|uniref:NADP-dependent oxidoreductase domain-containing protein n=1 Tax=Saitozyma podzolica TaxID=1890683 RepID=A0A427YEG1_9TREE|nr:hypothetical protein EHS25_002106 [Saitozyma podzolica]